MVWRMSSQSFIPPSSLGRCHRNWSAKASNPWDGAAELTPFLGSIMKSADSGTWRTSDSKLPYKRAIIKASTPLYKREFEKFLKNKDLRKRVVTPEGVETKVGRIEKP
jgi:hypothetical protein